MNTDISSLKQSAVNAPKITKDKANVDLPTSSNNSAAVNSKDDAALSISAVNKKQLNAQILSASLSFSDTIADQPMSLVLKAALEGINESLKALGVEQTIEQTHEAGIDVSPEATAQRIVDFSTRFFSSYQDQHPELDEKDAMDKFISLISGGIEQGFTEAREVLGGLNVLEGKIAEDIDKTFELVQKGLQDFVTERFADQKAPVTEG